MLQTSRELLKVLQSSGDTNPIALYTDGGPDHRSNYPTVQIALVCLFLQLNLDFLCAIRTPPYNSWKNPAERIMSLLNIALQGTGVVSSVTTFEDNLKSCNNLKQIRELATQIPEVKEAIADSVEAPKAVLSSFFNRLKLKGEPVSTFHA